MIAHRIATLKTTQSSLTRRYRFGSQYPGVEARAKFMRTPIDLIEGFSTAITKNSIIYDNNFRDCIEEIASILKGDKTGPDGQKKTYLTLRSYPDQIPEKLASFDSLSVY